MRGWVGGTHACGVCEVRLSAGVRLRVSSMMWVRVRMRVRVRWI